MHLMKAIVALFCALLLMTTGFALAQKEISIVCANFPCYDFARAITGGSAELHLLIKPGAEVHSYEPTPADIMTIAQCDLFIYVGGESDAWVEDILSSFGEEAPQTLRMFDCVEALQNEYTDEHEDTHADEHQHEYDEHIWTSPVNAARMVRSIENRLSRIEAAQALPLHENAEAYIAQIEEIDAAFRDIVDHAARREMIFADRFPFLYFANEYGIEWVAAFDSCSSESEPSAKVMMELIDRIVRDDVPVVYTIELSNQKTAKTIATETGVEICSFYSAQNVTESEFKAGESYVSIMRKNVEALKKGLN